LLTLTLCGPQKVGINEYFGIFLNCKQIFLLEPYYIVLYCLPVAPRRCYGPTTVIK
jgi:hypothetical protein